MKATVVDNSGVLELKPIREEHTPFFNSLMADSYQPHPFHIDYFKERVGQVVEIRLHTPAPLPEPNPSTTMAVPVVDLWLEAYNVVIEDSMNRMDRANISRVLAILKQHYTIKKK